MTRTHELAVVIGRFQPLHRAHLSLLERALELSPRVVVVLGSAHHARTAKDPFTWQERADMMRGAFKPEDASRVSFAPVRDLYDDVKWCAAVRAAVAEHAGARNSGDLSCALVGCFKDSSSYYLSRFPSWLTVDVPCVPGLAAKELRRRLFESEDAAAALQGMASELPSNVRVWLESFCQTAEFDRLRDEHGAIQKSRAQYGLGPFVTLDTVVTANDHVLLVRRGRAPGKDLWALPGGFLDLHETLLEGALRELEEETGLDLKKSNVPCREVSVFSHPERSVRGRTITHAHYFPLGNLPTLPKIAGADDAAAAAWFPIAELAGVESQFFDDHFHILQHFLG